MLTGYINSISQNTFNLIWFPTNPNEQNVVDSFCKGVSSSMMRKFISNLCITRSIFNCHNSPTTDNTVWFECFSINMSQEQQIQHEFNMPTSSTQQEVTGSQRKDEGTGNRNEQGGNEHERSPASPRPSIVIPPPIQCHPPPIHCHLPTHPLFLQHPHPPIVLSRPLTPPVVSSPSFHCSLKWNPRKWHCLLAMKSWTCFLFFWGGGGKKIIWKLGILLVSRYLREHLRRNCVR